MMSHTDFEKGHRHLLVCKPPEENEAQLSGVFYESQISCESIEEEPWAQVPIVVESHVNADLKSDQSESVACPFFSKQPSVEHLQTPVFSPRVLLPFKSLSLLESPSDVERPVIHNSSGAEMVPERTEEKEIINKEHRSKGFFFAGVKTPKPFLPLSPNESDDTWSGSETSSEDSVQRQMERNLKSEFGKNLQREGSMKYIKVLESPASNNSCTQKSPKIKIPNPPVEGNTPQSSENTPNSTTESSELMPFDVRPELLCGFESLSKLDSPNEKRRSGYLSTYIERRDSLLKGLVADGGTRDFALWFERLGPSLHCNQDFHTETGIFNKDIWHNPFSRSNSFDRYLGLKAED